MYVSTYKRSERGRPTITTATSTQSLAGHKLEEEEAASRRSFRPRYAAPTRNCSSDEIGWDGSPLASNSCS